MTLRTVAARLGRPSHARTVAARRRMRTLLGALGADASGPDSGLENDLVATLGDVGAPEAWLTLAVLHAQLPEPSHVAQAYRRASLDGARAMVAEVIATMPRRSLDAAVEVATDEVLIDVNHLSQTTLRTGIQRVTYETVRRWDRDHRISLVRWSEDFHALYRTTAVERRQVLQGTGGAEPPALHGPRTVVVPWRCRYILPEVALELARTARLQALALYARSSCGAIGFDTVPLTSAETAATDVPSRFMRELAALRHVDRIATISGAAATEYSGWRRMLTSLGLTGPDIAPVILPMSAEEPTAEDVARTRARYAVPGVPVVLCVGSHEPRKNHLAVLHAAELLWRRGLLFSLVFVGGNAWHSERFRQRIAELRQMGRPVESALQVTDATLWSLYRVAHCTIFPSFNEGFGLPVAESIASGTPVITADYGSMREIGESGGALLVDPRDDHAIADALEALLTDEALHARLTQETLARPTRTWDDYAADTWNFLAGD